MNPARLSSHDGVVRWKLGKERVSAPGTEPESRVTLEISGDRLWVILVEGNMPRLHHEACQRNPR